jgi:hypothetical protein
MNACTHRFTQCSGMKENYSEITLSSENYKQHTDASSFIFQVQPTRRNIIHYSLLLSILYMFQAVSPPIIRSSNLYTPHRVYSSTYTR